MKQQKKFKKIKGNLEIIFWLNLTDVFRTSLDRGLKREMCRSKSKKSKVSFWIFGCRTRLAFILYCKVHERKYLFLINLNLSIAISSRRYINYAYDSSSSSMSINYHNWYYFFVEKYISFLISTTLFEEKSDQINIQVRNCAFIYIDLCLQNFYQIIIDL